MFSCIASLVSSCLNSAPVISDDESSSSTSADPLLWCRDLERHSCGEVSFAVVQANDIIEDHSQVEIGTGALFVGVYDGHGGSEASSFIKEHLFHHLMSESFEFLWMFLVSKTEWNSVCFLDAFLLAFSSICYFSFESLNFFFFFFFTLHIANVGDSRAVIASTGRCNKIKAEQLSIEHNASRQDIREELRALHPQDPHIVVVNRGSWRVKGIIQVSRSIGDAYLKNPQSYMDSSSPPFPLTESLTQPVLTAEPSLSSRVLQPRDKFLIFASDGLWEHLTNQQAVEIVHRNPRNGIARKLVKAALKVAAHKRNVEYKELLKIEKGIRRPYHDDITVIVVFIDHDLLEHIVNEPEFHWLH
ncbi:probable protein phosphatase 2C 68 [Cajanus cajan]|uniref:protein-serine/threonine phosphatase n=2 Tax=Cajanus cajan TaxID=3821 RepID=A0A151R6D1_CAJCA|nr:probable protein phosphatase 2C 68 [Cajanus cajan]KYP38097.1 putative protein phosphatase 2C 43 [Cajanus cajan]